MTISFAIDDDLEMIGQTVRKFGAERLRPRLRKHEDDRAVGSDIIDEFADLGFDRLELPPAFGGSGLGVLARVLVNRHLGSVDAGAALALDRLGLALYALQALGGDAAVGRHLVPLLEQPAARAVLVHETGSSLEIVGTSVTGEIPWVPADRADLVVGLGLQGAWLTMGAKMAPINGMGLRAAGASRMSIDGEIIERWDNADAAAAALSKIRLYYASLLLGVLYDATEFSRDYAQGRVAFGQPIAHHQGMAFLIVDMFTAVERVRHLVFNAACRIDAGERSDAHAAAAFVEAVEASRFIGPNAVQILGGHGFMADYPMEKAMRELRALGLLAGGIDRAREDAGTEFLPHKAEPANERSIA
jgi:alkylation response protein AidB-like acyl-CoA dehydrogenase